MQGCEKNGCSATFFDGVDTRDMNVEVCDDGAVGVTQVVCGSGVEEVYGSAQRLTRVRFDAADVARLEALLDANRPDGALERYIQDEDHDILDLMDLCDRSGVAYTKMTLDAK